MSRALTFLLPRAKLSLLLPTPSWRTGFSWLSHSGSAFGTAPGCTVSSAGSFKFPLSHYTPGWPSEAPVSPPTTHNSTCQSRYNLICYSTRHYASALNAGGIKVLPLTHIYLSLVVRHKINFGPGAVQRNVSGAKDPNLEIARQKVTPPR